MSSDKSSIPLQPSERWVEGITDYIPLSTETLRLIREHEAVANLHRMTPPLIGVDGCKIRSVCSCDGELWPCRTIRTMRRAW